MEEKFKKGDEKQVKKLAIFTFKIGNEFVWLKYYQKYYRFNGEKWEYYGKGFVRLL